jgi:hypothetical protein
MNRVMRLGLGERGGRAGRLAEPVDHVLAPEPEQVHRHLAGDEADAHVAGQLQQLLRAGDVLVGGELAHHRRSSAREVHLPARRVNKYARRIQLTIGLLCSKTFQYQGLRQVIQEHGVAFGDVAKLDIKGRLLVWRRTTGERVDIPLRHCGTSPARAAGCARTSRPRWPACPPAGWASTMAGR